MNEQEIEGWYDEEKEKLMERYLGSIERKVPRERAREAYSRSFKRLHSDFEKRMRENILLEGWRAKANPVEKRWKGVVGFFR